MYPTNNLHVLETSVMLPPDQLKAELPTTEESSALVHHSRQTIRDILHGRDPRILAIVGPCSIHDPVAALDYARRLADLRARIQDDVFVVMRVYFEKPRTTVGWKGLINDPDMNGSHLISKGLGIARGLLLKLTELEIPVANEMLDPITPEYVADM